MNNVYIIIVEPVYKGNVGAVARIMNNFEFNNLRIIGSIPEKDDFVMGVHSEHILSNAMIYESFIEAISDLDRVIAFSRRVGKKKNEDFIASEIGTYIKEARNLKIGLVFGRETYGLTDEEAKLCDIRCRIPANKHFPSINLAQSVTVILYEIYSTKTKNTNNKSTKEHLDTSINYTMEVLDSIDYFKSDPDKQETQDYLYKIMHRANSTKKMSLDLMKMFNRIYYKFHNRGKGFKHND